MNLAEMKNTALRAAPGDWEIVNQSGKYGYAAIVSRNHGLTPQQLEDHDLSEHWEDEANDDCNPDPNIARILDSSEWLICSDANLEFMVTCSPKKVLELIAAYETLLQTSK